MTKKRRYLTNGELTVIASTTSDILSLNNDREYQKTLKTVDFRKLIDTLIKAFKSCGCAEGRSADALDGFIMRLMHMGNSAFMYNDTGLSSLTENDCVIIVSKCGDYTEKIKTVSKIGAKIILITSDDKSPTAETVKINPDNMVIKICDKKAIRELNRYFSRKYRKEIIVTEYAPLGTLFEGAASHFMDCVIAMVKNELGLTEAEMRENHKNF